MIDKYGWVHCPYVRKEISMEDAMDRIDDFFDRWGKIKERAEVRNAVNVLVSHGVTPEQYGKIYESGIFNGENHD